MARGAWVSRKTALSLATSTSPTLLFALGTLSAQADGLATHGLLIAALNTYTLRYGRGQCGNNGP
ncbi:MAG: hypothetical protein ACJAZO_001617 [Myxococcota bacterium]|jgi:hypothetical protein